MDRVVVIEVVVEEFSELVSVEVADFVVSGAIVPILDVPVDWLTIAIFFWDRSVEFDVPIVRVEQFVEPVVRLIEVVSGDGFKDVGQVEQVLVILFE